MLKHAIHYKILDTEGEIISSTAREGDFSILSTLDMRVDTKELQN